MLKKFKDWLIKKLGGYTKAEYDDFSRIPVCRYEFLPPQNNNIVTLSIEGEFSHFDDPPTEWIEDMLMAELARKIKPHVHWERGENYSTMKTWVRAIVKVVAR